LISVDLGLGLVDLRLMWVLVLAMGHHLLGVWELKRMSSQSEKHMF